jgi:hypothetical protein
VVKMTTWFSIPTMWFLQQYSPKGHFGLSVAMVSAVRLKEWSKWPLLDPGTWPPWVFFLRL